MKVHCFFRIFMLHVHFKITSIVKGSLHCPGMPGLEWQIHTSGVARKISRAGKTFQGGAKISKSKIFRPKKLFHEFHETCHSVTFIVLVNSHLR